MIVDRRPGGVRARALAACVLAGGMLVSASPGQNDAGLFDRLYAAYAAGDVQVLQRTLTWRNAPHPGKDMEAAFERWDHDRRPVQVLFMLDLARCELIELGSGSGLDLVDRTRKFIMSRPDPPGRNPGADALEIAWHKAAASLVESFRRPDLLESSILAPLKSRMAAAPGPANPPRLVDPWIELTSGIAEEQWADTDPLNLSKHGLAAIRHFSEAATYPAVEAEARVRVAWMFVRLGRFAEALTSLDALGDRADDAAVRYWSRLFRGRALEGLGRPDDAARAYVEALGVSPRAQSPAAALASLAQRRGDQDEALRWSSAVRTSPADAGDPWWTYGAGEYRLLSARLDTLRAMSR